MSHYLYVEIDGVQRFVFASPKLKIIRGGSAMLDLFNRVEMLKRASDKGGETVFAGGGHCLIRGLSKSDAESVGKTLERELRRKSEGQATLSWAVTAADASWPAARHRLEQEIQRRRSDPVPAAPPLPPFVALCSSCGAGPARELADMRERHIKPVCGACLARLDEMHSVYELHEKTVWQRLRPHLGAHAQLDDDGAFKRLLPQRELEDLADQSGSSKKYLAYLYCDGNGMGRALAEAKSVDDYRDVSTRIDGALHRAVAKAIRAHCAPGARWENFRAEVLLLGGDDLIVALPAECAVRFTETVLREFLRETDGRFRLSAGLVFAPPKTPITILQQTAEKLLRSAKRRAYLDEVRERFGRHTISPPKQALPSTAGSKSKAPRPPAEGYVDFQELASAQSDIEREHTVTCRPYRLDDFMTLAERTRNVHKCNVPRGRLHALAEAIQGSRREAHTMTQLVVGRAKATPTEDQKAALLALLQPPGIPGRAGGLRPFLSRADMEDELPFDLYDQPDEHRWSPIPDALELIDHLGSMDEVP